MTAIRDSLSSTFPIAKGLRGSAPRNSSKRSQTEETLIGEDHGQATAELERGGKVGDGASGVERAPERGGGGPPAGGE